MKKCIICYDEYTSEPRDVDGACFSCDLAISSLLNHNGISIQGYEDGSGSIGITAVFHLSPTVFDQGRVPSDEELKKIADGFIKLRQEHPKRHLISQINKMMERYDVEKLTEYISKYSE